MLEPVFLINLIFRKDERGELEIEKDINYEEQFYRKIMESCNIAKEYRDAVPAVWLIGTVGNKRKNVLMVFLLLKYNKGNLKL